MPDTYTAVARLGECPGYRGRTYRTWQTWELSHRFLGLPSQLGPESFVSAALDQLPVGALVKITVEVVEESENVKH